MMQGTTGRLVRVAALAMVLFLQGVSAMVVETNPPALPEEMDMGEIVRMTIHVTLDCNELLAARAMEPALMNDIGYLLWAEESTYLGGPGGIELTAPISDCYGNETVTLTDEFSLGLARRASAFENQTVTLKIEPKTSEPLKQTWDGDFWTKAKFINSTSFTFANGITDIEVNQTAIAGLNFINAGNADLDVRPRLVPVHGSGDCGTAIPALGKVGAYNAIGDHGFQFSVALSEPSVPVVECRVFVDVEVLVPDGSNMRYTLEGPMYTLRPYEEEDGQNVPALSVPFTVVAMALAMLRSRGKTFRKN